jgi:putative ABC transport system permease protein
VRQDLRYAARTIVKQPGFTATIIATLALGIAVNTTVFTIVNAAVLRPLPFPDVERMVTLSVSNVGNAQEPNADVSYLDFQEWQTAQSTFTDMQATRERGVDIADDEHPAARVNAAYVSWNTFSMIGQPPALGRDFTQTDDRTGGPPVVILGGNLWRARYGADASILGKTIRVAGVPSTVVGIMPPGFGFPDNSELWLPLVALPESDKAPRNRRVLDALGRLRPGVSIEQATTDLAGIMSSLAERYPDTNRNTAPLVARVGIAPPMVAVMFALLGAVGFVLLIACANVVNLMLARAADRSRDVAVRLAMGASRWRIVRQLLVESLFLAAAGGVCGLGLSYAGVQIFRNLPPESAPPYWVQFTMDTTVFAFLVALCVGSAVACSLAPAWHAARPDLATTLNDISRATAGSRNRRRWMGTLVVIQVALALVLLTGAGLMMRNFLGLVRTDPGVETGGLIQMTLDLRRADDTRERRLLFLNQLDERLASAPGVGVALASQAPMGDALLRRFRIEGSAISSNASSPPVSLVVVGERYFDVVGVPVIAGRTFTASDLQPTADTVVVNERFASMYFQNQSAVGQRVLLTATQSTNASAESVRWANIIGVVGNVRQRLLPSREFDPVVYQPYAQDPPQMIRVITRSAFASSGIIPFVQEQVRTLDADRPLFAVGTVNEALARQFWPQRLFGSMFTIFASIAMLLATCGLYAITSYAVSRRTREIGVRVALGADSRKVWWAVTGTTLRQLSIGVVLGTAGAAAIATVLPAFLVGSGSGNILVLAGVVLVLVGAGIAASTVPARRAMRLDPTVALQSE